MTELIIAADGTRYIKETTVKRRRRTVIGALCAIPLALFASAAIIGLVQATGAPKGPDAHTREILRNARAENGNCWAEWNEIQRGFEVICSNNEFNDGFADSKQDDCEQGFAPACEWLRTTKR